MMSSVRLRFRCHCGAHASHDVRGTAMAWTCPSCARRWRPTADALSTVVAGVTELRKVRREIALLAGAAFLLTIALVVVHPPWLLAAPLVIGGTALVAGPSYRRRVKRGRDALNTPIGLCAA